MVSRYGEFVLYKPPMKLSTLALWFGPLFLFALAAIALYAVIAKRADASLEFDDEQEQFARLVRDREANTQNSNKS